MSRGYPELDQRAALGGEILLVGRAAGISNESAGHLQRMRPLCEKIERTTLMREPACWICGGEGG
jgi:hypothetical protein